MAWTQTDLDTIESAIASGVRMVTVGGQTTTFQTVESLKAARAEIVAALQGQAVAANPAARPPARRSYATYGGRAYDR